MSRLRQLRAASFVRQNRRCYYCQQPMWDHDPDAFARLHAITLAQARQLKLSAEHLRARADGGENTRPNVVAACVYCNAHRHRSPTPLPPRQYRDKVRIRMAQGRWHGLRLL